MADGGCASGEPAAETRHTASVGLSVAIPDAPAAANAADAADAGAVDAATALVAGAVAARPSGGILARWCAAQCGLP